jgi:hypothetical protein
MSPETKDLGEYFCADAKLRGFCLFGCLDEIVTKNKYKFHAP